MRPVMTKFVRMALEAAVMAVLAGLLRVSSAARFFADAGRSMACTGSAQPPPGRVKPAVNA
jgi:hypothetical protein